MRALSIVGAIVIVLGVSFLATAYYIETVSKPMQKGIQCLVDDRFCGR